MTLYELMLELDTDSYEMALDYLEWTTKKSVYLDSFTSKSIREYGISDVSRYSYMGNYYSAPLIYSAPIIYGSDT